MTDYQPWAPMSDPVDLKVVGKFAEECGEAGAIAARCIIQGAFEHNAKEGKSNLNCLQDEISDVLCNAELVIRRFGLDRQAIVNRIDMKTPKLMAWHGMP
jgi:hypothetical protein